MEFGIISDIHDNLTNLKKAITLLKERNIHDLVVCGDFCSPFVVAELGNSEFNVHAVFGNNDGDRFNLLNQANKFPKIKIYGEFIGDLDSQLIIDGIKIGVTHYPFYAHTMIKTGWFDCVFFGHTHKYHKQKFGSSLLMNPGEIAGVFGEASFAIYNTEDLGSEQIFI